MANLEGEKRYLILIHFFSLLIRLHIFLFTSNTISSTMNHQFLSFIFKRRDYEMMISWVNYISGFFSSDKFSKVYVSFFKKGR